jgi:hypothetical protein
MYTSLQDKRGEAWDTASWQVLHPTNIPRQTNSCDCGVFSLLFCNRLGLGQPFDFLQVRLSGVGCLKKSLCVSFARMLYSARTFK